MRNDVKTDSLLSVGYMPAFGSIYYSQTKDELLLIPTSKEKGKEEDVFSFRLYAVIPELIKGNKKAATEIAIVLFVDTVYGMTISLLDTQSISNLSYILFLATALLSGVFLGSSLYNLVNNPASYAKFREIDFIDNEIASVLKKKLRKDIAKTFFITLLSSLSLICIPQEGISYLVLYKLFMPMSPMTFLIIELYATVLVLVWKFSPIIGKYRAYKAVKRLNHR